ncbi:MAG TPA: hypothetical protein VH309_09305, partial [Elusimicrobiota bacterium]|nr:hypothetical protein [Elusimicrobiota bacterium]
ALLAAALAAAAAGGASVAQGQLVSADLNVLAAEKFLDTTDWGPTNRQGELGLMSDWQWGDWPAEIAVDLLAASRQAPVSAAPYASQEAHTFELGLGARKFWRRGEELRPFLGAGPEAAFAVLEYTGAAGPQPSLSSGVGGSFGAWADGGVLWAFTPVFNLGFDARWSAADVRLFGGERDAGGLHFGLFAGYHFGS